LNGFRNVRHVLECGCPLPLWGVVGRGSPGVSLCKQKSARGLDALQDASAFTSGMDASFRASTWSARASAPLSGVRCAVALSGIYSFAWLLFQRLIHPLR